MYRFFLFVAIWLIQSVLLIFSTPLKANNYKFEHISLGQGLSQVTLYSLIQDSRGFIWAGTMDGLNKFDGYKFTVYRYNPFDSTTISNNRIYTIFEDRDNKLWVGTDGGLNLYDPDTDKFTIFMNRPGDPLSLSNNFIRAICQDSLGFIWVGTENGLNRIDPNNEYITQYFHISGAENTLLSSSIIQLYNDFEGNIWISSAAGLQKFSPETNEFTTIRSTSSGPKVNSFFSDDQKRLWLGMNPGLSVLDIATGREINSPEFDAIKQTLAGHKTNQINKDSKGNLWFGTNHGLVKLGPGPNSIEHFIHDANDSYSLSFNEITAVFEDRSSVLWIGTYGGGINIFHPRMSHFKSISFPSLSEKFVYAINKDRSGNLWIGSNNGLKMLGPDMKVRASFKDLGHSETPPSHNKIRSIFIDSDNQMWLGTYDGLDLFDPRTGNVTNYATQSGVDGTLSENTVVAIIEDSEHYLWIGTQDGLNRFDRKTKRFINFRHNPNDPGSLSENQVRSILQDSNGDLWIGTYGGGLNKFNKANNSFVVFRNEPANPRSISSNYIYSVFEDSDNNLWIGTYGGGLNRFDPATETFEHYKIQDGLPNELIYGILEDGHKNLWLSTNHGISRLSRAKETKDENIFRNYDQDDGLLSNEFNFGAYFKDYDGTMYFGSINGLNYFHPDSIKDNLIPPQIVITDFKIANQVVPIGPDSPLKKHINQVDHIDLDYHDNVFTFEFAALHFVNPVKHQYAYMLEGVDKDWVSTDASRRFASYTTLPGGDYRFRVRASNSDGIWNLTGKEITVTVIPAFWETLWFKSALIGIIIIFAFLLMRVRTRQIKLRNRYLESINTELNSQIQYRKQIEYDLQKSEEKFRTLTTNINAGIYRILPAGKGKFIEVNPAMLRIFGFNSKTEFLGVTVEDLYQNSEDRTTFLNDVSKYGHVDNREMYLKKKDGTPIYCSISAVAVKDHDGKTLYHDGLIEDITQSKLLESRVRQTQKMEAIGQLAGGVAHDFNNILTVIQGHAELGMMKIQETDPVYKDLQEIHVSGERAGNLTRQLLAFSRKQPMALQVLDMNSVILNMEKMVRRLIGEDIKINIDVTEGIPAINADPGQLEQILLNILINARDAINEKKTGTQDRTISIKTSAVTIDDDFVSQYPGSHSGPHILLTIRDTGKGMDETTRLKIFDPFFTTKEPGKGTGLGLATVFGIVKQNNGSIYVNSNPGKGTTFNIYWPSIEGENLPTARTDQKEKQISGDGTILLVEDDDGVRQFSVEILQNLGYNVLAATNGHEALEMFSQHKNPIHLLITDIIMPEMNGRELAEKITKLSPELKVLLISGYPDNYIGMDGVLDQKYEFLQKPFSVNSFGKKVRKVLSENA